MTKQEIDNHFVKILPLLETVTLGLLTKKGYHSIDHHAIINEVYLYLLENQSICNTPEFMQRISINWINKSIGWSNSKVHRQHLEKVGDRTHTSISSLIVEIEDDSTIQDKIELENWYNEKISILSLYRQQEPSREKQIIFDLYFKKGLVKGVDLAKHLRINVTYGARYLKQLKEDIKNFETIMKEQSFKIIRDPKLGEYIDHSETEDHKEIKKSRKYKGVQDDKPEPPQEETE